MSSIRVKLANVVVKLYLKFLFLHLCSVGQNIAKCVVIMLLYCCS